MSFRYLDLKRAYPFQISLYFFFQFFLAAINHNPSFKTHEPILSKFSWTVLVNQVNGQFTNKKQFIFHLDTSA